MKLDMTRLALFSPRMPAPLKTTVNLFPTSPGGPEMVYCWEVMLRASHKDANLLLMLSSDVDSVAETRRMFDAGVRSHCAGLIDWVSWAGAAVD